MDNNINLKDVGQRIKAIRQARGFSQEEFGEELNNANKSLVSRWENGKNLPNNERLKKISDLSGFTVEQILYGEKYSYNIEIYDYLKEEYKAYTNFHKNILGSFLNEYAFERADNQANSLIESFKKYTIDDFKSQINNKANENIFDDYQKYKEDVLDKVITTFKDVYDITNVTVSRDPEEKTDSSKVTNIILSNTKFNELRDVIYETLLERKMSDDDIDFYNQIKPLFNDLNNEIDKIIDLIKNSK